MKLNRIVVAVDFSPESQHALDQAMNVARKSGAELILLHVCGVPEHASDVQASMKDSLNVYEDMLREQLKEVRAQLEDVYERNSGQGVELSQLMKEGHPDTAIVDAAKELQADLIVTGSHGRTGLARLLIGSVAERVVRLADVPVLVARPGLSSGGFDRILVPVDFSPITDAVLDTALAVAAPGAQIDLIHTWEVSPMSQSIVPVKVAQDLVDEFKSGLRANVIEKGGELISRHAKDDVSIIFHPVEGRPNDVIDEWVKKHPTTLVVTGSHGRRGLRRFILGSVAEATVRHVKCSVLVVHGPTAPPHA